MSLPRGRAHFCCRALQCTIEKFWFNADEFHIEADSNIALQYEEKEYLK
jgi:hypothetical protein